MKIIPIVSSCALAFLLGCQSPQGTSPLTLNGMPAAKYLVGGGPAINWTATSDGVVYFADATTRKIIQTKSVEDGDRYEMELELTDEEVLGSLKNMGIDPQKATFQLFFVPARIQSAPEKTTK